MSDIRVHSIISKITCFFIWNWFDRFGTALVDVSIQWSFFLTFRAIEYETHSPLISGLVNLPEMNILIDYLIDNFRFVLAQMSSVVTIWMPLNIYRMETSFHRLQCPCSPDVKTNQVSVQVHLLWYVSSEHLTLHIGGMRKKRGIEGI